MLLVGGYFLHVFVGFRSFLSFSLYAFMFTINIYVNKRSIFVGADRLVKCAFEKSDRLLANFA